MSRLTFDVCGPLPVGITLLEASAGTGKTFTVGALVARYVAEGRASIDQLLVITFGRAASQELRERVRAQLVAAQRAFDTGDAGDSSLLAHLLDCDPEERGRRRLRLRDALADFDAATIATTHQFCQLVLRSLGVAGDTDAGATLVDSLDDLVVEVVDDLYLGRFGRLRERPPFGRDDALALARKVVGDPQAELAPADQQTGSARVDFALAVRAEVERRKRRLGILSYDDLLSRLAIALEDPTAPARTRMRERWRIVLVDEFQDTDPVQWQVLDRAFSADAEGRAMVLIGDPKQAIYAFRGGDVATYLTAAAAATTRATLGTNWRSDAALLARLQTVLGGAALGDPGIVVHPVEAHHRESRLAGAPHPSPFRLRRVPRSGFRLRRGLIAAAEARAHIAEDLAGDVAELLAAEATWCRERVRAGHVAVLVATRDQGTLVQDALHRRGIPAVVQGGGDVFLTPAGEDWLALLTALESPHRSGLVRSAALTCFLGFDVATLDAGGEALTAQIADTLRGWALLLRGRGVAALVEAAEERGLTARVLGRSDGERLLTDVRHLGQLLHDTALRERLGLTALLAWFREERRRTSAGDRPRRLDSDAAAVQIVTIHASKGLEYPVVYLPFAYQRFEHQVEVALFHDAHGQRTLDVTGGHLREHLAEESGEDLRRLYVAATRAQSQLVAWWAPTANTGIGGLHRMLFGRQPGTLEVPAEQQVGDDEYAARILGLIEQLGGPTAELSQIASVSPGPEPDQPDALTVRTFDRSVDADWRRTSYSALIRVEEDAHVTSEPEESGTEDEPETPSPALPEAASSAPAEEPLLSPMAALPAGAAFGTLVHAVLEHADPRAPDLGAELLRHVREQVRFAPVGVEPDELAAALVPLHHTPLGPLAPGLTLADIGLPDRLRELDFELPLAGGDRREARGPEVLLRDVAPLLRAHLPADDPMAPYADRLESPLLGEQVLRGYLSGSVDAVLRLPDDRFLIVDYKTNFLGPAAGDYTDLAEAMLHSHYPLQALLYAVVVHRYLRWRLPGYDPEQHLGGVLYLYLRGMCGPATPLVDGHPAGVFSWRPPTTLVLALSDVLDGAAGPGGAR
ncbi:UvrD-helicase domain-containing protein [Nocardioides sp. BP30]|uniref:UvrD-helicase domain-containing protein n=1 Tax=Nocardioides sp. BP30 TaxID=3036374 RepID=UPI0024691D7E|nr:UvrD-helicase domain-containing protein [Nocardioides sp. BP30]WGL52389.1 UvrD-helicase domain-containing protein [Nocardioides sp. BP30]